MKNLWVWANQNPKSAYRLLRQIYLLVTLATGLRACFYAAHSGGLWISIIFGCIALFSLYQTWKYDKLAEKVEDPE